MSPAVNVKTRPTLAIQSVTLTVNDLTRVADYYQQVIGLHLLKRDSTSALLGCDDHVMLELREDRHARRSSHREAGLFHTAFLLPDRKDLASWLQFAADRSIRLVGMADHDVSEALYLADPEGNGIELYIDRPRSRWQWNQGHVFLKTEHLDVDDILKAGDGRKWAGFPAGSTIGHMHLQVGELSPAETFYRDVLRLDVTCYYPGAVFLSADGYHHHVGANIWNSVGAGMRKYPSTGLACVQMRMNAQRLEAIRQRSGSSETADTSDVILQDPWGTQFQVSAM